ncbi:MAG: nucleoside triphosphate pyrophosphohydrolase family protein [Candidatus Magasanikbacteria bacterium]|jgi:NTP pyrophosphatase (non-canonical NTP hydrolase)|nr:nucleoside triphosphate pyrophosphohydrolase family protein [Candidatus Magasanikbacteria bacterium]MBT4220994.1 nucleoside triphosphate pyrophosphohydrolase family protein [Candidatus Magasanikbacteria bacterium]MBT4350512.1 nucleoside triphosphate pyrophosphohydrolase family protein [Candidatus Magasanikbacteria bacterium]MBT4541935.1 nucleoside triphosphate pyrophosphohydrolase family protein [Candidatus Magasanikbacteria bacterium]MBT6252899.1 nucleoside triphosphate pyrophosphohydrolase
MDFTTYQSQAKTTAIYPNKGENIIYPTLGLVNEAGEVAGKVKKIIRDNNGVMSEERRQDIGKELGDVLWYLSQVSIELGIPLETIAKENLEKLASRQKRNKLQGNGDNR